MTEQGPPTPARRCRDLIRVPPTRSSPYPWRPGRNAFPGPLRLPPPALRPPAHLPGPAAGASPGSRPARQAFSRGPQAANAPRMLPFPAALSGHGSFTYAAVLDLWTPQPVAI